LQVGSLGKENGHLLVRVHQPSPMGQVVVCSAPGLFTKPGA
jgi:hypothetical protein